MVLVVLAGVVGWVVLSYAAAWLILHPVTRPVRLPRELTSHPPRDVSFTAGDGTELSGWWFATPEATAAIILCHGAFENRMGVMDCVAPLLAEGYNVLAFDLRARGRSGGALSTLGKLETEDVLAAAAWVRSCDGAPHLPLGVMGFSQGGAAAIMAAVRCSGIAAVLADSTYASLDHAEERHLRAFLGPFAGILGAGTRWFGRRMLGFAPSSVRPVDVVRTLTPRPLLLIHGDKDRMISPDDSRELCRAAGANAALWVVPGARHTRARGKAPEEYWRRVGDFWREALGTSPGAIRAE